MNSIKDKIKLISQKGAFHIFGGTFLTRFVSLFASVVVVRILSKSDYGILSYYDNLYSYFFLLAGYGLANAVLRYVVLSNSQNEKYSVFHFTKWKGTLFNLILLLIGIPLVLFYRHPSNFASNKIFLAIMLLFLPFQYIVNLCILNERAFYDNKRYAFISFAYSVLLVVFKLIGAILWQLVGAILLPLTVHLLFSIFVSIIDKKKYYSGAKIIVLPTERKKEINKYAIQYMITNGLWAVFALNSTFILGRMIGDAELVADYRIATVIPGLISIVSNSFGIFVAPYFTKHEADCEYDWVKRNWVRVMLLSILLIGIIVIFLYFFAPFAIKLVFSDKYTSSFPLMRLLLIAALFDAGIRYPTSNLMAAMNKIRFNMFVSVVGIIMQVIFAILLAYKYGVSGIAISNIISQIIMAFLINVFFIYCFFIKKK